MFGRTTRKQLAAELDFAQESAEYWHKQYEALKNERDAAYTANVDLFRKWQAREKSLDIVIERYGVLGEDTRLHAADVAQELKRVIGR